MLQVFLRSMKSLHGYGNLAAVFAPNILWLKAKPNPGNDKLAIEVVQTLFENQDEMCQVL
jgi:hypothetical protein